MTNFASRAATLLFALSFISTDASAWGLATHVHYAEALLALPLALPALLAAGRRLPQWVAAGACLPDLALFGRRQGTDAFRNNHQWSTAHRLLAAAGSDEERAAALGYSSHLYIDVIAHNHFVPLHEKRWPRIPKLTHAAAEWAMDVHLGGRVRTFPAEALRAVGQPLSAYVSEHFGCTRRCAAMTLRALTRAETLLRASRLPQLCYRTALALDRSVRPRFDQYLAVTTAALPRIDLVLAGAALSLHPDGADRVMAPLFQFIEPASKP